MEYLGNCTNSFDEDGNCTNDRLPWSDVSAFACALEAGDNITVGQIVIQYDVSSDIHYFYKKIDWQASFYYNKHIANN